MRLDRWLLALLFLVGAVYAFTALGDSPVLSTAFTESVAPAYLGGGLALRSLLSFGAGAIAPLVFGAGLDATNPRGTTRPAGAGRSSPSVSAASAPHGAQGASPATARPRP